jgi:hypothetical protein
VATFIGLLALVVSAYTAYIQRQQVRAQVIPILQFGTSNTPHFDITVDNKGVGPALIKHVIVTVDGEAFTTWHDVLAKIMGPGKHLFSESDVSSLILSPNETLHMVTPYDDNGELLTMHSPGGASALFNEGRMHLGVEICYCSTLGDCWMLNSSGRGVESRSEVRNCPKPSARTFRE